MVSKAGDILHFEKKRRRCVVFPCLNRLWIYSGAGLGSAREHSARAYQRKSALDFESERIRSRPARVIQMMLDLQE